MEFLSSNTTSLIQPMDMDIIKNLKFLYRSKLVPWILETIDNNLLNSTSTVREISSKIDILQAIIMIGECWDRITSQTIINCFSHCRFSCINVDSRSNNLIITKNIENDDEINLLERVQNAEEFLNIEENSEFIINQNNILEEKIEDIHHSSFNMRVFSMNMCVPFINIIIFKKN
jgi:hypothetical protein